MTDKLKLVDQTKFKSEGNQNKRNGQEIEKEFLRFVDQTITAKSTYDRMNKFSKSTGEHRPDSSRNLRMITMHFSTGRQQSLNPTYAKQIDRVFGAFKSWYLSMNNQLLGHRFNKRIHLQPFVFAFLDVEGTRQRNPAHHFTNPHIHALLLLNPKTVDVFDRLASKNRLNRSDDPRIDKIAIEPVREGSNSVKTLASYASKFARLQLRQDRGFDAYRIYPDVDTGYHRFVEKVAA